MRIPIYLVLLKLLNPGIIFNKPSNYSGKSIYITFDDGPFPGITENIIDILDHYNVPATFFCVGINVQKYPYIISRMIKSGYSIGNHTFDHLNGWEVKSNIFINNINKCETIIKKGLFRPPYGRLTIKQIYILKKKYKIIMWDINSYDYDSSYSTKECINHIKRAVKGGSIILFHDNEKSAKRTLEILPEVINYLKNSGYTFLTLESNSI